MLAPHGDIILKYLADAQRADRGKHAHEQGKNTHVDERAFCASRALTEHIAAFQRAPNNKCAQPGVVAQIQPRHARFTRFPTPRGGAH